MKLLLVLTYFNMLSQFLIYFWRVYTAFYSQRLSVDSDLYVS